MTKEDIEKRVGEERVGALLEKDPVASKDEVSKEEMGGYENDNLREENILDIRDNRELRNKYANRGFWYLVCYSIFVGGLLLLSGWGVCGFSLGAGVLMVLVGSTAVSAIGLVYAVIRGLFAGIGTR